jgi:antitoxin component of RelBE/YafQ-DinJ toxin-antitoxin module
MNTVKTNLVIPINTDLKNKVKSVLDKLGFTQAGFIKAIYAEVARTGKLPLSLNSNDDVDYALEGNWREPTEDERKAIEDFEKREKEGKAKFTTLEDLKKEVSWLR